MFKWIVIAAAVGAICFTVMTAKITSFTCRNEPTVREVVSKAALPSMENSTDPNAVSGLTKIVTVSPAATEESGPSVSTNPATDDDCQE